MTRRRDALTCVENSSVRLLSRPAPDWPPEVAAVIPIAGPALVGLWSLSAS